MSDDRVAALGDTVTITGTDGSSVVVALHGGHVVSWRTGDGVERLFLSSRATTANGAAIRGGIPVCFPQFAGHGPLPKHGFARTARWEPGGPGVLELRTDGWPGWPHRCRLALEVLLGPGTLTTMLRVENVGSDAFSFTGALHSYLACDDVATISVSGLDGRPVLGGGRIDGAIRFPDPARDVDLTVLDAIGPVHVSGGPLVAQTGFRDVVVWNVGATLGASMADLGEGEWSRYVCVEAAAVGEPVTVEPGGWWTGTQTLTVP